MRNRRNWLRLAGLCCTLLDLDEGSLKSYGFDCFCLTCCSRFGENLEQSLPNLKELILTSNNIQELGDLDPLATVKSLTLLRYLLDKQLLYTLYCERQEAEKMFRGKRGAQLAKDIAKQTKTFTPGAALQTEKKTGPSAADVEAIKNAIANATSLAEVERLKGLLQSGQIPGRELRSGITFNMHLYINLLFSNHK
uniref:U2 small nuclear ribonucleoprotein A'-like n=1 Tax=Sinocyclocheilus grahami TaxID=75366 RepID=A0A672SDD4_SINGR